MVSIMVFLMFTLKMGGDLTQLTTCIFSKGGSYPPTSSVGREG